MAEDLFIENRTSQSDEKWSIKRSMDVGCFRSRKKDEMVVTNQRKERLVNMLSAAIYSWYISKLF